MKSNPDHAAIPAALKHFDSLPDSAHVRVGVVAALCGVSIATIWRRARLGVFPRPRKLSDRVTAWNVAEIRHALNSGRG